MYNLNVSIITGTPRWSQRAYSAIFEFWSNAIVFMMEEGAIMNVAKYKDDWRVALMAKITEWTQENDTSFIPIVHHWDLNEEFSRVPSLVEILGVEENDLPHIYLFHPYHNRVEAYPEKLDDIAKFSPELVMTWAEKTIIEWQIADYYNQLQQMYINEEGEEVEAFYEEQKANYRHLIADEKYLLGKKKKEFENIQRLLPKYNTFHTLLDDHFDVAESHMNRIEQSHMEEL